MPTKWMFELTAFHPDNEGWKVGIQPWLVKKLQRRGPKAKFFRMLLVKEVCETPLCIHKGWDRDGYEEATVYIGKPSKDLHSDTIELPAPPNMLFFVFVLPDGTIDDWQWRICNEGESCGDGIAVGKRIWPT